ncbi:hypothetical protein AB6802_24455 [Mesorhizobium sp. RCC_202]|uniref:hypothetical protein n=1 Tax=Mesorhizobium sp. RCC_202 TaxID=3239222 RepID=UPI003523525D
MSTRHGHRTGRQNRQHAGIGKGFACLVLAAMIIGVLLLDLAAQSSQVANQTRIHTLDPTARSRLNTIFMATMILGGACGSGIAGLAYSAWGWSGTCLFGAAAAAIALFLSRRS